MSCHVISCSRREVVGGDYHTPNLLDFLSYYRTSFHLLFTLLFSPSHPIRTSQPMNLPADAPPAPRLCITDGRLIFIPPPPIEVTDGILFIRPEPDATEAETEEMDVEEVDTPILAVIVVGAISDTLFDFPNASTELVVSHLDLFLGTFPFPTLLALAVGRRETRADKSCTFEEDCCCPWPCCICIGTWTAWLDKFCIFCIAIIDFVCFAVLLMFVLLYLFLMFASKSDCTE